MHATFTHACVTHPQPSPAAVASFPASASSETRGTEQWSAPVGSRDEGSGCFHLSHSLGEGTSPAGCSEPCPHPPTGLMVMSLCFFSGKRIETHQTLWTSISSMSGMGRCNWWTPATPVCSSVSWTLLCLWRMAMCWG